VLGAALVGSADAGPTLPSPSPASSYYEAAVAGDREAQAKLGMLYARGQGIQRSDALAFQWLWRAAGQGHAGAQLELSEIFALGRGVPRSLVAAYEWAWLAEANADGVETAAKAARMVGHLQPQLSAAQIEEARSRGSRWQAKPERVSAGAAPAGTARRASEPAPAAAATTSASPASVLPADAAAPAAAAVSAAPEPTRAPRRAVRPAARTTPHAERAPPAKSLRHYLRARLMHYPRSRGGDRF
jgi:hypothetical protein